MAIFSFLAFCLWVLAAVYACRGLGPCGFAGKERTRQAGRYNVGWLAAPVMFAFVPPGSLPPFCDAAWGGLALAATLTVTILAAHGKKGLFPCLALIAVFALFAAYARQRGMPGSPCNLGTLVAMPVWSIASPRELAGFALLAPSFVAATRIAAPEAEDAGPVPCSAYLGMAALFVVLFLPWNLAPWVRWPSMAVAGCDYLLFWAKTLLCCYCLSRLPLPSLRMRYACVVCSVAGAFLIHAG